MMRAHVYVRMICREPDAAEITKRTGLTPSAFERRDIPQGCVQLVGFRPLGGEHKTLFGLANDGFPFIAWHDCEVINMISYDCEISASDGAVMLSHIVDHGDRLIIPVSEKTGRPSKTDLKSTRNFVLHLRKARRALESNNAPKSV